MPIVKSKEEWKRIGRSNDPLNVQKNSPKGFRPIARAAPEPICSGISFRTLPDPSLNQIIATCQHYEKKCGGKYTPKSPAARYVFQLSREVQTLSVALRNHTEKDNRRIRELEQALKQWGDFFGAHTLEGAFQQTGGKRDATPENIHALVQEQSQAIQEHQREIRALQNQVERAMKITFDEREAIEVAAYQEKNKEIEMLKMQHEAAMKLQRELHAEMEQNLRKGLTANNRPFDEATSPSSQGLVTSQALEIEALKQKLEDGKKDHAQQLKAAETSLRHSKTNMATQVEAIQEKMNDRIRALKKELQEKEEAHESERQSFVAEAQHKTETKYQADLYHAQQVEYENEYLSQRVADLEELVRQFQHAIQVDPSYLENDSNIDTMKDDQIIWTYPSLVDKRKYRKEKYHSLASLKP